MTPQGTTSVDLGERYDLTNAGFVPCVNPSCGWMHGPGYAEQECPSCGSTPEDESAFYSAQGQFAPGGWTRSGLSPTMQGQLAEKIVQDQGEIPGYGPITWWAETYNSPLDGGTKDWGIEVKSANVDAHQQFVVGVDEKTSKNAAAEQMGYKGILGLLVVLDYRRSVADVYAREFTLEPWKGKNGRWSQGLGRFHARNGYHLLEEVPFENPFMSPRHPAPVNPDMPF